MIGQRLRRLAADRSGVATIEFLVLAPLMFTLILAITDIGNVMYTRHRLINAVAAGATYGMTRVSDVSTSNATNLASSIATLVGNTTATGWAQATVVVNNGPVGTNTTGTASATTTTTASTNGLCYCPNSLTDFGSSASCGATCPSGGIAGRFVRVTAKRAFSPVFSTYGIVTDGYITVNTLVQVQ